MSKDDGEGGYGRPPKAHRFKKGQSGNPSGRRAKAEFDKLDIIARIYAEPVTITIDGKQKKVSSFEASVRMTLHTAMKKGDARSFARVMELIKDQGGDWRERWAAEAKQGAEAVMLKIGGIVDRLLPDTSESNDLARRTREEMEMILACDCCGPTLKRRWREESYPEELWSELRRLMKSSDDGTIVEGAKGTSAEPEPPDDPEQ